MMLEESTIIRQAEHQRVAMMVETNVDVCSTSEVSRQLLVVYAKGLYFSYSYSIKLDWYKLLGTSFSLAFSRSTSTPSLSDFLLFQASVPSLTCFRI